MKEDDSPRRLVIIGLRPPTLDPAILSKLGIPLAETFQDVPIIWNSAWGRPLEYVCPRCFRFLVEVDDKLTEDFNRTVDQMRDALREGQRKHTCSLNFSHWIPSAVDFKIARITNESPAQDQEMAVHVYDAMYLSLELPPVKRLADNALPMGAEPTNGQRFVSVRDGQVVGYLMVDRRICVVQRLRDRKTLLDRKSCRWTVNVVWIPRPYRRTGVATQSVRAVARYLRVAPPDLGWQGPFSPAGDAFSQKMCLHGKRYVSW